MDDSMRIHFMSSESVEVSKRLSACLAIQTCLCQRKRGSNVSRAKFLNPGVNKVERAAQCVKIKQVKDV